MTPYYLARSLKTIINIKKIIHCLPKTIDKDYPENHETHDFWEMVYVDSGEASVFADGKRFVLDPGDIVFHKPNEVHGISTAGDEAISIYCVSFQSASKAMNLFRDLKINLDYELIRLLKDMFDTASATFENGYNEKERIVCVNISPNAPTGGQQLYKLYLETFLIKLIHHIENKEKSLTYNSREDFEKKLYHKMVRYMKENVYSDFGIKTLCEALNYTKTPLSEIFGKYSGTTVMKYFNSLRIEEAKRLIKNTDLSFAEIAEKLRYGSQYYFSHAFKKSTGVTPSEYRKF